MVKTIEKEENRLDIKVEEYFVAFLDILGFKDYVDRYIEGDTAILKKIKSSMEEVTNNVEERYFKSKNIKIKYKQFSDCTSISLKNILNDDDINQNEFNYSLALIIIILRDFQYELLETDVYIRGAFSLGVHFENKNLIFSEALIKSYNLELTEAMYPRIILDVTLFKYLKIMYKHHKDSMINLGIDQALVCDWDGLIFINPFKKFESSKDFVKTEEYFKDENEKMEFLCKLDKDFMSSTLQNVEKQIYNFKPLKKKSDYNKLRKYLWIKELIKWNQDPKSSKIRFEKLEYEHFEV
jgi:hypothetical protein